MTLWIETYGWAAGHKQLMAERILSEILDGAFIPTPSAQAIFCCACVVGGVLDQVDARHYRCTSPRAFARMVALCRLRAGVGVSVPTLETWRADWLAARSAVSMAELVYSFDLPPVTSVIAAVEAACDGVPQSDHRTGAGVSVPEVLCWRLRDSAAFGAVLVREALLR